MSGLYPTRLGYLQPGDIEILEHEILEAHLTWDSHGSSHGDSHGSYPANMTESTPQSVTLTTQLNMTPTNQTEHQSRRRRAVGTCKYMSFMVCVVM